MEAQLFEDTTVTRPRPADVVQMRSRGMRMSNLIWRQRRLPLT